MIRLDKYLTEMSVGTRSEVKKLIRSGRVSVNGIQLKKPEQKLDVTQDKVCVDEKTVSYTKYEYFMLNKPIGYVSATTDKEHKTVLELITDSSRKDLFPVGRLDIDTEGLLLITNDGELAHRLLSPKHHVDKTYFVIVKGKITKEDIENLENGMDIGDEDLTLPASVANILFAAWDDIFDYHKKIMLSKEFNEQIKSEEFTLLELTIHEGRYHQIKRMLARLGKPVIYLKRISMGSLELDKALSLGDYRSLTEAELKILKNT